MQSVYQSVGDALLFTQFSDYVEFRKLFWIYIYLLLPAPFCFGKKESVLVLELLTNDHNKYK